MRIIKEIAASFTYSVLHMIYFHSNNSSEFSNRVNFLAGLIILKVVRRLRQRISQNDSFLVFLYSYSWRNWDCFFIYSKVYNAIRLFSSWNFSYYNLRVGIYLYLSIHSESLIIVLKNCIGALEVVSSSIETSFNDGKLYLF